MVVGLFCLSIIMVEAAPHHGSQAVDCDSGHPADVIFLLDASNSIWRPDFVRQIGFIRELTRMFRIGPSHTQIAVVTYAEYPQFQFHLNYYSTKSDILAAIDSIRQMGGYHTSTPAALKAMRERGFNHVSGARTNVTRVGIVITDGNSDEREKTASEAEKVRDAGIHLFAVGVGESLDISELEAIASPPSKYYTFAVDSYAGLDNIKELLAIKACTVTDPPTTPSTTTVATTTSTTDSTTLTTTTEAAIVPSTENPLFRRTPELEGPRSTSVLELLTVSERDETVDEFQRKLRPKPETGFKENEFWEYEDDLKQWRPKKGREWSDARQDGSWVIDKDGQTIWVSNPGATDVNGTLIPNPGSGSDYEVDPVDPGDSGHNGGSSKGGPPNKRKPSVSGSKRNGTGTGTGKDVRNPGHHAVNKHPKAKRTNGDCRPKTPLDVVFIIDPKTRDKRHRRHLLETVRNAVEHIDMDNGQMRVQFVQSCAKTDRIRNRSTNKLSLLEALNDAPAPSQGSTADLFHSMTSKLTTNGKPGRKRVGVYLTNGPSGDFEETLEAVQQAKNEHDVEMFTIGLGKDLNPVELRAISSCDVSKHMFTARNNSKSKELARQLTKSLCSVR